MNRRDTVLDKLKFRDLWFAVGRLSKVNDLLTTEQLSDMQKNDLKTIFKQLSEDESNKIDEIDEIEVNQFGLWIRSGTTIRLFKWGYESVKYVKWYV